MSFSSAFRYLITPRSNNAKTGPIMVTTSPQETCPKVCPLRLNGCYADAGPLRRIWDRLSQSASAGDTFPNGATGKILVHGVEYLGTMIMRQHKALWRMNQAGDLYHDNGRIVVDLLTYIWEKNKAALARGFTYTHHAVLGNSPMAAHNRGVIEAANEMGFTINLSGNNLAHADKLADLNIGPVVAVVPSNVTENHVTPKGRKVVICPATQDEHTTCYNCGMCQLARDFIIAFPAHGNSVKKADLVAA